MSIYTANYQVEWKPGASWVDITAYTLSVEGQFETTGANNGVAFGDSSSAAFSVTLDPARIGTLSLVVWELVPVRVTFTMDVTVARGGAGVIVGLQRDTDTATLQCEGYQRIISRTRMYSVLFERRPIATKTTATSVENPASGGYAAGPINYALWQSGGRPYEQAASYPTASFYYSLQHALIAPDVSWLAGEDAWEACLKLVRAAGGQLYQRPDGVIAYVTPLSLANGTSVFSLSESDYESVEQNGAAGSTMASVIVPYQTRYKAGMQQVIDDTTPRVVGVGETITIDLEPSYPLYGLETESGGIVSGAVSATFYDGRLVAQGSGYTHTLTLAAQRIMLTITNVAAQPFVIERIALRGIPSAPGEAATVTLGSGQPALTIEPNDFIQTRAHAQRLGNMALDFFAQARPIITVRGVLYNPALDLGAIGTLTVSAWGISDTPVALLGKRHADTGTKMDVTVVDITGLPQIDDFFLVSTSAQIATKRIGY